MCQKLKCSLLKLLTRSAVLCSLALPFPPPAHACSFPSMGASTEYFFKAAKSAFVAHVTKTEEKFMHNPQKPYEQNAYLEATFEVIEVLKGTPPASGIVHDLVLDIGNCSIGLTAGQNYLFMPGENMTSDKQQLSDNGFSEHNYVGLPTGSRMLPYLMDNKTVELLNKLRTLANKPAQKQDAGK